MHQSNNENEKMPGHPLFVPAQQQCGRYKKHNKERILYTNTDNMTAAPLQGCAANEVEFEDILSDHGHNEKEIFRFPRPLF